LSELILIINFSSPIKHSLNHSFTQSLIKTMSQVSEQLNKVIERTERLIELCAVLQEENDLLKLENETLNSALNASKNKTKELEEKLRVLKLAKSFSETNEKSVDIKQKINEFVQEIDKCIVLLKK
jgi:regulator of replication initiation timing